MLIDFIEDLKGKGQRQSTYILRREELSEISLYLNDVVGQIVPLEYFIEHDFDPLGLSEFIAEDLPDGSCWQQKEVTIKDIVDVSWSFWRTCKDKKIRIQFEVVTNDKCRLFHVDNIKQRLLCTYRGLGTEWLDDSNVNRSGLCRGDNDKIVKNFDLVKKANQFDILVLQGKKSNQSVDGAVHRSPPLGNSQEARVLLKIDEC